MLTRLDFPLVVMRCHVGLLAFLWMLIIAGNRLRVKAYRPTRSDSPGGSAGPEVESGSTIAYKDDKMT